MAANKEEHEAVLKLFKETNQKIDSSNAKSNPKRTKTEEEPEKPPAKITNIPSSDMVGVDANLLQLCATISKEIYDEGPANRKMFQKLLTEIPEVKDNFPDLQVRFFDKGVTFGKNVPEKLSFNPPTFTAVITGDTLILGWRGTKTVKDMIADISFGSTAPWDNMKDLEVQKVYYERVDDYFNNKGEDVCSFVTGNYMINSNKKIPSEGPDGTRIKTIILTGHSLGGGLAQVAHLFLKLSPLYGLADACEEVDIRTVAFSAPMTTFLNKPDGATTDFLENFIEPKMCNVVFNTDIVPRAYGNLRFINSFVNAFLNDDSRGGEKSNDLADTFVNLVVKTFKNNEEAVEQAESYRHVGKLIYYEDATATPVVYVDGGFSGDGPKPKQGEKSFHDLHYGRPDKVAETALDNHMTLVSAPGLAWKTP
jgi:hypothetical protein